MKVKKMDIDIIGVVKLMFFLITHPVGAYHFSKNILNWLDSNKFQHFNLEEAHSHT
jgi:hypothetical protein